jgi:uncharacterized protein YecT (DUF1311 family)
VSKILVCTLGTIAVLLLTLSLSTESAAASEFECSKAAMPFDYVVCSAPELIDANGRLASAWGLARNNLSDQEKHELVIHQKTWMENTSFHCGLPAKGKPNADVIQKAQKCILEEIQDRIDTLTAMASSPNETTKYEGKNPGDDTAKLFIYSNKDINDAIGKMRILYSADDEICTPLLRVYENIHKTSNKLSNMTWEDAYHAEYKKHGFTVPPHLEDSEHPYYPVTEGCYSGDACDDGGPLTMFYQITDKDGKNQRIVLVEDTIFIRQHDYLQNSFSTNVFILKAGADFESGPEVERFPPQLIPKQESVSTAILFGADIFPRSDAEASSNKSAFSYDVPTVTLPYMFEKNDSKKIFSYVGRMLDGSKKYSIPVVWDLDIGLRTNVTQRLFKKGKGYLFIASDKVNVLAYELGEKSNIKDVCYMSTDIIDAPHGHWVKMIR